MSVQQLLEGQLPWWASAFAAVLLSLAAAIARRVTRRSARPQGERIGEVERVIRLERTRRQQVEATLIGLGVPLPYWPPDGLLQPRDRRFSGEASSSSWSSQEDFRRDDAGDVDEHLADDETAVRRVPVPPLPDDLGARHRRAAAR